MSYDIIKSIAISKDKVYITGAANNVSPRTFERWESKHFTNLYKEGGMEALLKGLAAEVWEGNFHLQRGSKMCRYLQAAMDVLTYNKDMRNFLDTGRASQFMCDFVLNILGKGPMPDVSKLYALRKDKDAVLDICKKRPDAFHYAAPNIQADRDVARQYIENCKDMLMFFMPQHFKADKELALLALKGNGCIFRGLDPSLQADKEIIRLAFDPNQPRKYFEHLPDLIPESVRKDKPFMMELVTLCPQLHMWRADDLISDKDIVMAWFKTGAWNRYKLQDIPASVLKDPEVQSSIFNSPVSAELKAVAKEHLEYIGVSLAKPSLNEMVQSAEAKRAGQTAPTRSVAKETER